MKYDIILQENDFIDHCDIKINTTKPYIVKIRGLAKIKPKEDLFLNILEDKKPLFFLAENVSGMLAPRHAQALENIKDLILHKILVSLLFQRKQLLILQDS